MLPKAALVRIARSVSLSPGRGGAVAVVVALRQIRRDRMRREKETIVAVSGQVYFL
jgi:hypothetical protein